MAAERLPFFVSDPEPAALQAGPFAGIAHRAIPSRSVRFEPQLDHMAAERLPFFVSAFESAALQAGPFAK